MTAPAARERGYRPVRLFDPFTGREEVVLLGPTGRIVGSFQTEEEALRWLEAALTEWDQDGKKEAEDR